MLSTGLFKADCQNLLSTGLLQGVSTSRDKFVNNRLQQADFNGLVATR